MKTYPIKQADGRLIAFEINNFWTTLKSLLDILKSIPGVTEIKRTDDSEDHIFFRYEGAPFVVHEPWGDSSRYWIGPIDSNSANIDIAPLHQHFLEHQGWVCGF